MVSGVVRSLGELMFSDRDATPRRSVMQNSRRQAGKMSI